MAGKYGIGGTPVGTPSALPKRKLVDRVFDLLTPKPSIESPAAPAKSSPGAVGDVAGTVNAIKARNKALRETME